MKKNALIIIALFLAGVAAGPVIAQEAKEEIKIVSKSTIGKYLTGSDGRALYYFKKDSPESSECTGACAETWPVYCYTTEEISVPKGLKKSDFVHFHNKDADTDHLTYKGRPLYRYSGDKNPGDTNGHGINGQWFLVRP